MHDEELAAGGVGSHGASHGQHTCAVVQVVFETVAGKFALDAVAGAAGTSAQRVAALNHETGNDAVEDHTVIKTLVNQGDEVVHRVGCNFGVQLCLNDTAVFHFDRYDGICHGNGLLFFCIVVNA